MKRLWNDVIFVPSMACIGVVILVGLFPIYDGNSPYNALRFLPFPFYLLFTFPYIANFLRREDVQIHQLSRFLSCMAFPLSLLSFGSEHLTLDYLVVSILMGVALYLVQVWESSRSTQQKENYTLWLDPSRRKGLSESSLHENVQIVGSTGAGKTHHVLKPLIEQTIGQGLGVFVVDVKSNMVLDLAHYAQKYDRIDDFYYFDLGRPERSMTCNPLIGNNAGEIASQVFTALYYDTTNVEPHYVQIANGFLQDLIYLMKLEFKTITFQDLATATGETETFRNIAALCAKHPETEQAKNFQAWLRKSPKQRQDELSGLILKLRRFCNREWSPLINCIDSQIKMEDIVNRGKILLLGLASAKYPDDAKPLSILFMMALQRVVAERYMKPPEKPFRVALDEFYNLAYPGFIDLINKCRDAKVNLLLAHQSNGDLRSVSEDFKEQVMNTANNKIILRVSDPATAEYFADLFGTEKFSKAGSTSYDSGGRELSHSLREAKKYRVHPDDIKELPVGEAFVRIMTKERPITYRTKLGTASPAPVEDIHGHFSPLNSLPYNTLREMKNKSSLWQLFRDDPPQLRKGPSHLGAKFGEGANA